METQNPQREPYEAPTIEDVPLHPEETVLAGCKTGTNSPGNSVTGFNICALCVTQSPS
ncbi:MAG TPA: hypothetical protein VFF06_34040 [Polyangia bacterium]|nr:hypothetical protein [Polyangia bacterium]